MKLLVISTNVFPVPLAGYGGLEQLCFQFACEFQKAGHQVSVVAPQGSQLPEGMELIATTLGEAEEASWAKYKDRLMKGDWDAVMDNSWQWYSILSQMEADRQLPIIHCYHSDPHNLGAPPPIEKPCLVAFSNAQAEVMGRRWSHMVKVVLHGIDTSFYTPDSQVQRGNRYLFLARYTPEKGFLEIAHLARKCGVGLDCFGDTTIVSDQDYVRRCFEESDVRQIRVMPGISREETVKQYRIHKALITWPNFVEIFGLTTVESMACGCPVISKDSGAAKELIKHSKTGFVVQTLEEAEELIRTDAVSKLKGDDVVRQGQRFSIEKSATGHLRCLQDVASGLFW